MGDGARLNRTSVGLKLWIYDAREVETKLPQSNQRGIETRQQCPSEHIEFLRLNRTSVGLKRRYHNWSPPKPDSLNRTSVGLKPRPVPDSAAATSRPQSNQRGIETCMGAAIFCWNSPASIEPAWD